MPSSPPLSARFEEILRSSATGLEALHKLPQRLNRPMQQALIDALITLQSEGADLSRFAVILKQKRLSWESYFRIRVLVGLPPAQGPEMAQLLDACWRTTYSSAV